MFLSLSVSLYLSICTCECATKRKAASWCILIASESLKLSDPSHLAGTLDAPAFSANTRLPDMEDEEDRKDDRVTIAIRRVASRD